MLKGREPGRRRRTRKGRAENLAAEAMTATEATDAEPPDQPTCRRRLLPLATSCCSSCRYLCVSPPADQPQPSSAAFASVLGASGEPVRERGERPASSVRDSQPSLSHVAARVGRRAARRELRGGGTQGGRGKGLGRRRQKENGGGGAKELSRNGGFARL